MKDIQIHLEAFMLSKKHAWKPSTVKTQRAKLNAVKHLIGEDPSLLWDKLCLTLSPYSRTKTFGVVSDFYDWLIETGVVSVPNIYKKWRDDNKLQFKNVYERKHPNMTMEEATKLIMQIEDESTRKKALELIGSGMRYTESFTYKDGKVTGKGSKVRAVFKPELKGEEFTKSYSTFWRHLSFVGLKPHDLRKLAASQLHKSGFDIISLCHLMGWSDPSTAMSYIKPDSDKELTEKAKKALKLF